MDIGESKMKKEEILKCKLPGDLFTSADKMDSEFSELAIQWHPDKPGGSTEVMAHINYLRSNGKLLIASGEWLASNNRVISLVNNKSVSINFIKECEFELGHQYICESTVLFVLKNEFVNMTNFPTFKYINKRMQDEFDRYIPKVVASYKAKNGSAVVAIHKPDCTYPLNSIIKYYNGFVPPKHVAWIISSLYNFCCFLWYNRISHNGITTDSYYINPEMHYGVLIGGWWYNVKHREKMIATNPEVYSVMPCDVKKSKHGSYRTDLECVKLIGRKLLGSVSGSTLYLNKDIPKPMIDFLRCVTLGDPVKDYAEWGKVLEKSFGPRRFAKMDIDQDKLF
jgi:hypothetical protein